ncbi:MAG: zinc ABC transporter substrate-binding protein [Gammaproteobacteria bacterium]|nr:zinc ABC transporter substrate-binding protein [Gammaproteobacteria bacterium]
MKYLKQSVLSLLMMMPLVNALWADQSPSVVVSIKPIHSLVAGVMGNTGTPQLLLEANASPHTYQMRPSQARSLQEADLVIWVGKYMENFMARAIENLSTDAVVITLEEASGIHRVAFREGGIWGIEEGHKHGHSEHEDDHDSEKHDDHDHEKHDDHEHHSDENHGHDSHEHEHAAKEHDEHGHDDDHDDHGHGEHEGHDHHDHGEFDVHIWLDPGNARRIVEVVADQLSAMNPEHADTYRNNASATIQRINETEASIRTQLSSVQESRFIVFHDAYRYFEDAFELESFGSFTVEPTRLPSAKRLSALREAITEYDVKCVFSEPQFKPDLVETVIEQTDARTGVLDPLGAGLDQGPDAWFMIIQRLADSFAGCLNS